MLIQTVDLSSITQPGAFDVDSRYVTVQIEYVNIDGDFHVAALQSLDQTNYDPILDFLGEPVVCRIKKRPGNTYDSGTKTFNIDASLYTIKAKLKVFATTGHNPATEGTVTLHILNSSSETTTAAPTTTV